MLVSGMLAGMLKSGQSPVFRRPDAVRQNSRRRERAA